MCVAAEETAKCRMGAYIAGCGAFGFDPPVVIWKGTEHQQRFARDDVAHGTKAFVAISEPSGGSDPGRAIQTRAERKSDRYVINGTNRCYCAFWVNCRWCTKCCFNWFDSKHNLLFLGQIKLWSVRNWILVAPTMMRYTMSTISIRFYLALII